MEIRISKKIFSSKVLWLSIAVIILLILNIVQFFVPISNSAWGNETVEIREIEVNRTVFTECPACEIKQDDLDKLWDKCLNKFDEVVGKTERLLEPDEDANCEFTVSTKRKAEVDDPIIASDCYKDQLKDAPSSIQGTTFTIYKSIAVDKICGDDVYGEITVKLDDSTRRKTIKTWDIPYTYISKKMKCDSLAEYDFNSYNPNS